MCLRPELAQEDRGDQLQRRDLERKIHEAVNEDSEERQSAKRSPHPLLAGDQPRVSPKGKNGSGDPAPDQHHPDEEPQPSPLENGLEIVLMRVAQDAVDLASMLRMEVRKDDRKSTRSESGTSPQRAGKASRRDRS